MNLLSAAATKKAGFPERQERLHAAEISRALSAYWREHDPAFRAASDDSKRRRARRKPPEHLDK